MRNPPTGGVGQTPCKFDDKCASRAKRRYDILCTHHLVWKSRSENRRGRTVDGRTSMYTVCGGIYIQYRVSRLSEIWFKEYCFADEQIQLYYVHVFVKRRVETPQPQPENTPAPAPEQPSGGTPDTVIGSGPIDNNAIIVVPPQNPNEYNAGNGTLC